MKNVMILRLKLSLLFILAFTSITNATEAQVVCNKFDLMAKITGSTLELALDTDLPDNTEIMVRVSRSYFQKGNTGTYSIDYFSEKSTVTKWKSKHTITLDGKKWKSALREKQEELSRIGLAFDVTSVSEKITAEMTVPTLGINEIVLTGKAVKKGGFVNDEININYPLDSLPVDKLRLPSLNPLKLDINQAYIVTKQTPLMPSHSPVDPLAALQKMKQIPDQGGFKILKMFDKNGEPWYMVSAFDQRKRQIGTGWINSTALFGQQLKAYK